MNSRGGPPFGGCMLMNSRGGPPPPIWRGDNACHAEKRTKHSSNTLHRLVRFSVRQTLLSVHFEPPPNIDKLILGGPSPR